MKYLLNKNFKAIRGGAFVEAHAESGELILSTENVQEFTVALLQDIAKANKIAFTKKTNKGELVELIEAGLEQLKLPMVNKMTDTQKALEIVKAAHDAGLSADETAVKLITEGGVPYKQTAKVYNECLETLGLRVSPTARKEAVEAILNAEEFNPEHWDEVQAMIDHIVANVEDTDERKAHSLIKAWAKKNFEEGYKLPAKPKAAAAPAATHGLGTGTRGKVFSWMLANPNATQEDLTNFILELRAGKAEEEVLRESAARFYIYYQFADMINGQRQAA